VVDLLDVSSCQLKTGEIAEHFGVESGSKAFDQLRTLLRLLTEQGVIACQQKRPGSPRYYWSLKVLIKQAQKAQQPQQPEQVPLPVAEPQPQPQLLTERVEYRDLADKVDRLRRAYDESAFLSRVLQAQYNDAAQQLQVLKANYLKEVGL